jgi:hypothetical protein
LSEAPLLTEPTAGSSREGRVSFLTIFFSTACLLKGGCEGAFLLSGARSAGFTWLRSFWSDTDGSGSWLEGGQNLSSSALDPLSPGSVEAGASEPFIPKPPEEATNCTSIQLCGPGSCGLAVA